MNKNTKAKFRVYMAALARFEACRKQFGDEGLKTRGDPLSQLIDARIQFEIAASSDFTDWANPAP